ncbi:MAG: hypothetical protein CVU56_03530 [Deltaproteobacteria bacterium HGW-Deltaproteobacteria-14]|jgi:hypothetical protein|nr:MAG: hypothetical protein CVU56_03530 [Deltaproteobacteria bacterium HGW-Deltaproteobacteria-14]
MPRARIRPALLLALVLVSGGCATGGGVPLKSPQLTFVNDESLLEERVGTFLESKGLKVARVGSSGDTWLVLVWDGGDRPTFRITIDSFVSSSDEGVAKERALLLRLETGVHVGPSDVRDVLERLNAHHARNWAGTWYIDPEDGQLEATWALNIPQEVASIEAGLVHDALVRLVVSWGELSELLGQAATPSDVL